MLKINTFAAAFFKAISGLINSDKDAFFTDSLVCIYSLYQSKSIHLLRMTPQYYF